MQLPATPTATGRLLLLAHCCTSLNRYYISIHPNLHAPLHITIRGPHLTAACRGLPITSSLLQPTYGSHLSLPGTAVLPRAVCKHL